MWWELPHADTYAASLHEEERTCIHAFPPWKCAHYNTIFTEPNLVQCAHANQTSACNHGLAAATGWNHVCQHANEYKHHPKGHTTAPIFRELQSVENVLLGDTQVHTGLLPLYILHVKYIHACISSMHGDESTTHYHIYRAKFGPVYYKVHAKQCTSMVWQLQLCLLVGLMSANVTLKATLLWTEPMSEEDLGVHIHVIIEDESRLKDQATIIIYSHTSFHFFTIQIDKKLSDGFVFVMKRTKYFYRTQSM